MGVDGGCLRTVPVPIDWRYRGRYNSRCTGTGYIGAKVVMLHHRRMLQAWGMGLVMSPVMVACMEG